MQRRDGLDGGLPDRRQVIGGLSALALGACGGGRLAAAGEEARDFLSEARSARDRRMRWWREARFGMFIHWGLYAVPAGLWKGRKIDGIGEWIQASANIPRDEYAKLASRFNPTYFNADDWAALMREAGMRYVVITSKHHDGFALWDSKVSTYDVMDATPFKRDILAELSRACRRHNVRFCTYHSILDWHHPSQEPDPNQRNPRSAHASNRMRPGQKEEFVAYLRAQLAELLKHYDPEVLWFDGEWVNWWTESDGKALYNWLRRQKPELIVNNRVGKGRRGMEGLSRDASYAGDFGTPEQQIPPAGLPGVDWETCMTMNDTWGYKSFDHNWKSATQLIRMLCDTASKGGNFLLNVGPTPEGMIPTPSVERLKEMGRWMAVNGRAIYGTQASPFPKQQPWGRITHRPGRLYLHVFDWPRDGSLILEGLTNEVSRARLLAGGGRVRADQQGGRVRLALPGAAPDPHASVVEVEYRGRIAPATG